MRREERKVRGERRVRGKYVGSTQKLSIIWMGRKGTMK